MPIRRIYNLRRKQVPTHQQIDFHERLLSQGKALPTSVDLRPHCGPVWDQGTLGSCTAHAGCGAVQFLDAGFSPSRLFLYFMERQADQDVTQDAGSTLTQCVSVLSSTGVCTEALWPYLVAKFADAPPSNCLSDATQHKVIQTVPVAQTLSSMRACLATGHPFVIGITVFDSFESDEVASTGVVPMPNVSTEQELGGHALLVVGFTSHGHWIVRNSWGPDWGDHGYCYLPVSYLLDTNLASDFHAVLKVNEPKVN